MPLTQLEADLLRSARNKGRIYATGSHADRITDLARRGLLAHKRGSLPPRFVLNSRGAEVLAAHEGKNL